MRSYGYDSARAMSEFFSKGCVPGALNEEFAAPYARKYKSYRNLCHYRHTVNSVLAPLILIDADTRLHTKQQ